MSADFSQFPQVTAQEHLHSAVVYYAEQLSSPATPFIEIIEPSAVAPYTCVTENAFCNALQIHLSCHA